MSQISRRQILQAMAAAAGAGPLVAIEVGAQGRPVVNLQLGWLLSGNQIGEVCAKAMGFYEQEGIELKFQAGGPNIDGVAVVAAGRFEIGQVSSSPSLMLAASQDIPVVCFAAGAQEHPYTFFSSTKKPVREPKDMVGKKVGIQATGVILLRALLAKNKIPEKDVTIVTIGADMSPLLTGQVDVVTGWLTNTTALKVLGERRSSSGSGTPASGSMRCPITPPSRPSRRKPTSCRNSCGRAARAGPSPTPIATRRWSTWSRSSPTSSRPTSARRWT